MADSATLTRRDGNLNCGKNIYMQKWRCYSTKQLWGKHSWTKIVCKQSKRIIVGAFSCIE